MEGLSQPVVYKFIRPRVSRVEIAIDRRRSMAMRPIEKIARDRRARRAIGSRAIDRAIDRARDRDRRAIDRIDRARSIDRPRPTAATLDARRDG